MSRKSIQFFLAFPMPNNRLALIKYVIPFRHQFRIMHLLYRQNSCRFIDSKINSHLVTRNPLPAELCVRVLLRVWALHPHNFIYIYETSFAFVIIIIVIYLSYNTIQRRIYPAVCSNSESGPPFTLSPYKKNVINLNAVW